MTPLAWAAPPLVFLITTTLTWRFCRPSSWLYILDHPNERSLHANPTPRSGGVAIVVGIFVGMLAAGILAHRSVSWLYPSMALLALVSFADDRWRVAAGIRLVIHVLAALLLVVGGATLYSAAMSGLPWELGPAVSIGLSLLFVVWMINLYNFMDGMDGFAGGMAVIGFGSLAIFGWRAGQLWFSLISVIIAAAAAGFLVFNRPPARIFMGDVGSALLGLLAAALSLWGARDGIVPFWAALLVFSPFIVDATVTLVRRLIKGEKVWQAHRSHYYQRLVRLGWGHKKTVLLEYVLMVSCAVSAIWASAQPQIGQWLVFGLWGCIYAGIIYGIGRMEEDQENNEAVT